MSIDFRLLREQIQIEDLLRWMSWNPAERHGHQLRGPCPFCRLATDGRESTGARSHSRCFSVNARRNIFRCFRCRRSGNALELWAAYRGLNIYQAAREIQDQLAVGDQSEIKQPSNQAQPTSSHATSKPATPPNWLNP